jgi:hypothetical protein
MVTVGCLVGTVAAGCGGGDHHASDQQQATAVVRSFLQSLPAGDAATTCSMLTDEAQRRFVAFVGRRAAGAGPAPGTCEDAVGVVRIAVPKPTLSAISKARVERVAVHGNTATGRVVDGGAFTAQRVTLAKHDGHWQISGVPTLIGS